MQQTTTTNGKVTAVVKYFVIIQNLKSFQEQPTTKTKKLKI